MTPNYDWEGLRTQLALLPPPQTPIIAVKPKRTVSVLRGETSGLIPPIPHPSKDPPCNS